MTEKRSQYIVRNTQPEDIPQIIELCRAVYPESLPWTETQLSSHLSVFPQGQFVAVDPEQGHLVGTASSLVLSWDDYDSEMNWRDFTDNGLFTNHDPAQGRTLYGAEVMVRPGLQGRGLGKMLYQARRDLAENMGLLRIRAGARLRGFGRYAKEMSAEEYVYKVLQGEIGDPTLSFQLKRGFHILGLVTNYLRNDPESLGYAAVIEWINALVAKAEDLKGKDKFLQRMQAYSR